MFMMMLMGSMVSDFFSGIWVVVVIVLVVMLIVIMVCRIVFLDSDMLSDILVYFSMMNCSVVFVF